MAYREAFDHDEPLGRVDLGDELGYLGRNLTYMGGFEWVPFEDFAADLRRCVAHLEAVLHDGEQVDRGVGCMTCRQPLTRVWGDGTRKDGWECKRCREFSTEDQYRFAVKADYIKRRVADRRRHGDARADRDRHHGAVLGEREGRPSRADPQDPAHRADRLQRGGRRLDRRLPTRRGTRRVRLLAQGVASPPQ
jgi:hypothetical protein